MRVLMAIDGSKTGAKTLADSCSFLSTAERNIELMCVQPPRLHHHFAGAERRAGRILSAVSGLFTERSIPTHSVAKAGSPVRVLIGASSQYDLIAVAAESRRQGSMAGLGPIAGRIAEHAQTSVLIARPTSGDTAARILVPVDGSDSAFQALDKLASLVDMKTASVTLLHVVETPWLHEGLDQEWLGDDEDVDEATDPQKQFEKTLEHQGEEILTAAELRLPPGTSVSRMIRRGLPADEILTEVEQDAYDLVVVGTSNATDLKHRILGSVSAKIVWNAPCSVLLVRGEA